MHKKGQTRGFRTVFLIIFIMVSLIGVISIGIWKWGATVVDDTFSSIDFTLGNQSFSQTYNDTVKLGLNPVITQSDNYGVMLLIGLIVVMLIFSYKAQERQKMWFISELFILIVAFILSVIIQDTYSTFINSSSLFLELYSTDMINSSKFVLRLPWIVTAVWTFMVILIYGSIRVIKRQEEGSEFSGLGF